MKPAAFHPVIHLPARFEVFDFSRGYDPAHVRTVPFGIGKYNERRPDLYTSPLFGGVRDIHMGIDLFAPVGTPIHAFLAGKVHSTAYHPAALDYGHTLVTQHELSGGGTLYALHGHLRGESIARWKPGNVFPAGTEIAQVGAEHENGGWIPHLHFQISFIDPGKPDMPGVVNAEDRAIALLKYPDPRLILGSLY